MQMNGRYVTFVLDEIYRVQKIQIWHFGFNFAVLHSVFTLMKSVSRNIFLPPVREKIFELGKAETGIHV